MIQHLSLGFVALGLVAGQAAHAQFKLDESPSGMRAANAAPDANDAAKELNRANLHPLSPLGGKQGTPLTIQPSAPVGTYQADAGTSASGPTALGTPVDLNGNPLPSDPSADDPNKVRQPLKPKTLQKGVVPR